MTSIFILLISCNITNQINKQVTIWILSKLLKQINLKKIGF